MRSRWLAALVPLGFLLVAADARGDEWDPKKTQVVLASVTRWQDPKIEDFEKNGRVEWRLEKALLADGVPDRNLSVLKDDAVTTEALKDALANAARKTPEGGTLIFYFSGHGYRDGRGTVVFATHDMEVDHARQTGLTLDDLSSILEENGAGKRILLLGDACYSGALSKVVKRLDARGMDAAALASVPAENQSTINWTFTKRVIDAFRGDGNVAKDGVVTLASLTDRVRDSMLYEESQPIAFSSTRSFDAKSFVIRAVDPKRVARTVDGPFNLQDYVDARGRDGVWRRGLVTDELRGRYLVRFVNESSGKKEGQEQWLPANRLREPHVRDIPLGTTVRVHDLEEHSWWDALVTRVEHGFIFAQYELLPRSYNEWVSTKNVRVPEGETTTSASDAVLEKAPTRTRGLSGLLDGRVGDGVSGDSPEDR